MAVIYNREELLDTVRDMVQQYGLPTLVEALATVCEQDADALKQDDPKLAAQRGADAGVLDDALARLQV